MLSSACLSALLVGATTSVDMPLVQFLQAHPPLLSSNASEKSFRKCDWLGFTLPTNRLSFPFNSRQQIGNRPAILFPHLSKARQQSHQWFLSASSLASTAKTPYDSKAYKRVAECLVFPSYARRKKPRALVHFIGGAFIGAVPEVTYRLFIDLLITQDFLVVATPYKVTFEHSEAAEEVHRKFQDCRAALVNGGFSPSGLTPGDIARLPVFSVGHSNGALLQLLIGSLIPHDLPKANAVISFCNKPATDSIPYFEQLGPIMVQLSPNITVSPIDFLRIISGNLWKGMLEAAPPILRQYDQETVKSIEKFTEQIPLVLDQITRGKSEFTPTPLENRRTFGNDYSVQNTLLVKYTVDPIDESDIVENILTPRVEKLKGSLTKITLSGNHITPCVQDIKWEVGKAYTPVDAMGQVFRSMALSEIQETVNSVSYWFERFM